MTKYIRTNELLKVLTEMHNKLTKVFTAVSYMFDSDDIDDSDFDDIDITMTRLIDAWEELRKTQKEDATE